MPATFIGTDVYIVSDLTRHFNTHKGREHIGTQLFSIHSHFRCILAKNVVLCAHDLYPIRQAKSLVYWAVSVKQHCAEINEAARKCVELIVPELAKQYGVTEKLKAKWNGYGR